MPLVLDAVGSALVVASGDPSDPVGRIPSNASNHLGGQPTGQEPEEVPAAAFHWILRAPVALREIIKTQERFEVNMSCHASLSTTLWRDPVLYLSHGALIRLFHYAPPPLHT